MVKINKLSNDLQSFIFLNMFKNFYIKQTNQFPFLINITPNYLFLTLNMISARASAKIQSSRGSTAGTDREKEIASLRCSWNDSHIFSSNITNQNNQLLSYRAVIIIIFISYPNTTKL